MNRVLIVLGALLVAVTFGVSESGAQCCCPSPTTVYSPTAVYAAPAPVVAYRPAPVVAYRPAPAVAYPAPVVTYRPAAPVVTYRPPAVAPVYAAPVVVARPVYVPGQPVRNALRTILP